MSTKNGKWYCDVCGKEFNINESQTAPRYKIMRKWHWYVSTEICKECQVKIDEALDKFFKKETKRRIKYANNNAM